MVRGPRQAYRKYLPTSMTLAACRDARARASYHGAGNRNREGRSGRADRGDEDKVL